MRIIAIVGSKGGSGKTTLTVNLGAALAERGRRVLLVDCDPQGAATAALGVYATKPTLHEVLTGSEVPSAAVRETAVPLLDLLASDLDLAASEPERILQTNWPMLLRDVVGAVAGRYDIVLLDVPAGFGPATRMALMAASAVLVACPPEFLGYRAVNQVMATIERAREASPSLRVLGIVPTLTTHRTPHAREVLAALKTDYPGLVMASVPRRSVVPSAQAAGRPINAYAPGSDVATAFARLAEEVLARSG